MSNFRQLKDTNNMEKLRIGKAKENAKYSFLENSHPDKTAFKRPPYYMTVGKKVDNGNISEF